MALTSVGSVWGTNRGPMNDVKTKAANTRNPSRPALLRSSSVMAEDLQSPLALGADARVETAVEQVRQQIGDDNGRGDDQEDALHDRIVALVNGAPQDEADALILEQRLDQNGAADDEAGGDCQLGKQGQHRVAPNVRGRDAAVFEPARPRGGHVVLVQRGYGRGLHDEHPGTDREQNV